MKPKKFLLSSRFGSFKFAFEGLVFLLKNEHNSRIHLLAAIAVIILGIIVKLNQIEWIIMVIVTGLVFIVELVNSSIETLADLINPEWNVLIKLAKDYGAAAVLISAIIALIAGCLIFVPKLLALIHPAA